MLRLRILLLFAALTLGLAVPAAANPLPRDLLNQPRMVVFEAFMRST